MKVQDIVFLLILALLVWKKNVRLLIGVGLLFLVISIPLFATWTFFTAERFTWYGAGLFLLSVLPLIWQLRKESGDK